MPDIGPKSKIKTFRQGEKSEGDVVALKGSDGGLRKDRRSVSLCPEAVFKGASFNVEDIRWRRRLLLGVCTIFVYGNQIYPVAFCSGKLYKMDMLTELFTSKTRIKLLLKLFLNPEVSCYLRQLSSEFNLSPNALKGELDSLSEAGYLEREQNGRSVYFKANKSHPFFPEISSIVRKTLGIDKLIDEVMQSLGQVEHVYILDDYAEGRDSGIIDLLVVGDIDRARLEELRQITEGKISRLIRTMVVLPEEFESSRSLFLNRPNWKVV